MGKDKKLKNILYPTFEAPKALASALGAGGDAFVQ